MSIEKDSQKIIINRLKKVEGQIRGIQKMVLESRDCSDILMQMSAVKSALKKTNYLILKRYADSCLNDLENKDQETMGIFIDTMNEFLAETEYEENSGGADDEKDT